jgi:hypothetical protein
MLAQTIKKNMYVPYDVFEIIFGVTIYLQSSVIDITLSRRINTVNIIRGSLILKRKEEEIWKKSKIQTFSIFGRL